MHVLASGMEECCSSCKQSRFNIQEHSPSLLSHLYIILSAPPHRRIIECTEVFIFMCQLLEWRSVAVAVRRAGLIEEHNPSLLRHLYISHSSLKDYRMH